MAEKITFLMILHDHQPVGNFDWVFDNAAKDSYVPFLDVLERFPAVRMGLHVTGPLLEWFDENKPDYLDRLGTLVKKGQLELLGGAFYEPIISVLPDRDKIGQIDMMNRWIEERFDVTPEGCWLAERIWEPGLASVVGSRGIRYTALDNTHFLAAGIPDDMTWGSYVTDDQGVSLRVLPIDYRLRYLIPFHEPQETIDYIGSLKDRGVTAVTYADDGEKFGVWPGTKKWVYEEGWLERFFTALDDNRDWIEFVLPGDYVRSEPPLGPVYLPTASYKEMMEWALPVATQKKIRAAEKAVEDDERFADLAPFIRGGFWRNFLAKYPESDTMYRRMLMVSAAVEKARKKPAYHDAARELYMAQCNCGYWHGVFGGLYLNFLRRAIYEHLIKAERLAAGSRVKTSVEDCNGDGHDEVVMENDSLKLFVTPRYGGSAYELDFYPGAFNVFDTFTRREEAYHSRIGVSPEDSDSHASIHDTIRTKDPHILDYLAYDWHRRLNFLDHFMPVGEQLEAFSRASYQEYGDFVNMPFTVERGGGRRAPEITLTRAGYLRPGNQNIPARVSKTYRLPKTGAALSVDYSVAIKSPDDFIFGIEMNMGLQDGLSDGSRIEIPGRKLSDSRLASTGETENVNEVTFTIDWMPLRITIGFSEPATLWRFPIETISLSEGGAERNYQNTCLVPHWQLRGDNDLFTVTITMKVETW